MRRLREEPGGHVSKTRVGGWAVSSARDPDPRPPPRQARVERGGRRGNAAISTCTAPPAPARRGPLPVPGASFAEVDVDAIGANPRQPRQVFDEDALRN